MRVVTWNVRSLRDDAAGVAAALRALEPDLVCVQEAPRLLLWRTWRWELARRSGLRVLSWRKGCGNLLLAGPSVRRLDAAVLALPRRPGLHRRALLHARIVVDGRELVVASTHLDLDPAARLDSARRVRAALPTGPLVLCGDVNDVPGSASFEVLAAGLQDVDGGPTFPARDPRRRIDALLVSPELVVQALVVEPTGRVSDHLAVRADLSWAGLP